MNRLCSDIFLNIGLFRFANSTVSKMKYWIFQGRFVSFSGNVKIIFSEGRV